MTATLTHLHHTCVDLGYHGWLHGAEREPALCDVRVGLNVCAETMPLAGGIVAREIRIIRDLLVGIAVRTGVRGGVKGGDLDMLRGCLGDLNHMLNGGGR